MNYNGRSNIVTPDINVLFQMKERVDVGNTDFTDMVKVNSSDTMLSQAFFSKQNIDILQNGLRAGVYKMSNKKYIIQRQNDEELKTIMRKIFLQYSRNSPHHIPQQITILNDILLNYAVKRVYEETIGYERYKHDISTINIPMTPPQLSRPNNKQLVFNNWF